MLVFHKQVWKWMGVIVSAICLVFLLLWFIGVLSGYLLSALVFFYVIRMLTRRLEHIGFPRKGASLFVGACFIIVNIISISVLIPTAVGEIGELPNHYNNLKSKISWIIEEKEEGGFYSPLLKRDLKFNNLNSIQQNILFSVNRVVSLTGTILFGLLIIVPFITYFLIVEGTKFKKYFFSLLPNKYFEVVMSMYYEVHHALEDYISAKVIQSVIVGVICIIGFFIVGTPAPLLLGFIAGLLNIVPYIGPLVGAILPMLSAFLAQDFRAALLALLVVGISQAVDNLITQPFILPRLLKEHALIVVLITLLGAQLFGPVGLLLGIPIYTLIKIILGKSYSSLVGHYY